jgi:cell volume regulation protein A
VIAPTALLAMSEPWSSGVVLVALGTLALVSVLLSRVVDRIGVPVLLLFLALGMLGGSQGIGGIPFENYGLAVRLGTVALVLILFDGGFNTTALAVRQVLWPATVLATVGVAATAGLLAVFVRLLGVEWPEALLLGAVVSSTDAAAVFAVLRGGRLNLKPSVGRTVEVESCVNDPMAVILTTAVIDAIIAQRLPGMSTVASVFVQLAVGAGMGLACGWIGRMLLTRASLRTAGLYPVLTLALAFISFGAATLAWGSGFLAVFVTGVVLGNARLPNKSALSRVHEALAWMSQVGMFLMMGLLVFPSHLLDVAFTGLAAGLFLTFVARPLAVLPCLLPFRYPLNEIGYIGWVGLRGAVPIVLATFPVLANVPGAERIFNTVFFIVVISSVIPGSTLRAVTRWMGLSVRQRPAPEAALEINSPHRMEGELIAFLIEPPAAVCGAALREIELPQGAAVVLIVRGKEVIAARGSVRLEQGDHAFVFFKEVQRPVIELLFGRPADAM